MSGRVIEWDCAARPFPGEQVSGDGALVRADGGSAVAVAVAVDGLGHGFRAAHASDRALDAVRSSDETDIVALVESCHAALRDTRGAAISVASIARRDGSVTWVGVGNVEGRVVYASRAARPAALLLMPGVVGHDLPPLRAATTRLERGDLLVIATDGVDPAYADDLDPSRSCRAIAREVLDRHARGNDDALVLVIRYLGSDR